VNEDPRRLNESAHKPYEDPRRIREDSRKVSGEPMKIKAQQGHPSPSILNEQQSKTIGKLIQDASKVLNEDPRLMKHDQRRLSSEHVNKHEHRKTIEKQRSYDPERDRHNVKGNEESRKSVQPYEVSKKVHDISRKTIVDPRLKMNESPRKVTEEQRKTVENRKSTNEDQTKFIGKLIEDASRLLKEDPLFCKPDKMKLGSDPRVKNKDESKSGPNDHRKVQSDPVKRTGDPRKEKEKLSPIIVGKKIISPLPLSSPNKNPYESLFSSNFGVLSTGGTKQQTSPRNESNVNKIPSPSTSQTLQKFLSQQNKDTKITNSGQDDFKRQGSEESKSGQDTVGNNRDPRRRQNSGEGPRKLEKQSSSESFYENYY